MLDSEIGTVATNFNIPNRITYITTICPANDPDKNYLFGGGSYTLIGMEYENHKYGYQFATCGGNLPGTKHRALNKGIWSNWETYVTNTDLTERFKPIRIFGTEGGTFSKALKNKVYNSVVFLAFDTSVPDNPFSFEAGYAIVFHAGLLKAENVFTLIGFDSNALHPLEIKMLDLRS